MKEKGNAWGSKGVHQKAVFRLCHLDPDFYQWSLVLLYPLSDDSAFFLFVVKKLKWKQEAI